MDKWATVNISKELRNALKKRAIDENVPVYQLLELILRDYLNDKSGITGFNSRTCEPAGEGI